MLCYISSKIMNLKLFCTLGRHDIGPFCTEMLCYISSKIMNLKLFCTLGRHDIGPFGIQTT